MRADAQLESGDLDGYAVWKRILRAVRELQQLQPAKGRRADYWIGKGAQSSERVAGLMKSFRKQAA